MGYLISINNQQSGPYSLGQLKALIQNGQVTLNYWICLEGSNNWVKIDTMPELKAAFDGGEQQPDTTTVPKPVYENRKLRHGFTSFVLWFDLIAGGIGAVTYVILAIFDEELLNSYLPIKDGYGTFGVLIVIFSLGGNVIGLGEIIFEWKKSGFSWLVVSNAVYSFFDVLNTGVIYNLIVSTIALLIVWGILHIHNSYNARTTWEQMR